MDNNCLKVYRHELKFLLSRIEYEQLRRLLSAMLVRDAYMGAGEDYYIRSLYFDTLENKDYYDKLIGEVKRKKIRLRIYDTSAESAKLEIKNKENDYSIKETVSISRSAAMQLAVGDYSVLTEYDNEIAKKAYFNLTAYGYQPKIIVDYEREAYMLPVENVRLTFDKNVRTFKGNGLFDKENVFVGVLPPDYVILEVKYDKYLPDYVKHLLFSCNMQRMSISKYCMAREM